MKSIYTLIIVLIIPILSINAQTKLEYKLKVGDVFKIEQVAEQDIVQDMNGSKHEMKNLIEGDFTFEVESVSDSLYGITFRFDRFKMTSTSNLLGEIISVDTSQDVADDDIQGKIFSQLVATDLMMYMYKNGEVKAVDGAQQLIENMVNSAGDFDAFTKELMKESVKTEFGNENLSNSFEQMTFIYPDNVVESGDSWTNKFEGELASENVWTLKEQKEGEAIISGESKVIFNSIDDSIEMNLTGVMTSDVRASLKSGFISSMTTTSTCTGNSILKDMNGTQMPTTITSNVTYKIVKNVQ
ncbi:DUF6263 family protein [Psychroserpens sp.]|uniref:DUF6263 family protein n=1 Tax=Psychroserpens sp. TaxID=2020870 RepID=UPI001B2EF8FC|nr:DUF6263 family protein [Psychroserpens sp.]MBO6607059.1 hypothetical protein [Psychroserpens sp.]MBO6630736.1 hypothetical protein [Psychroserpens sp.]MBO6654205.1 hypothetical protein [Psychroserpens sp.]MBO6682509.1 hypothetical protein [Psychroserpens sp.]MBO6750831.1 hypothetical protein [Psychroserpens sp.]